MNPKILIGSKHNLDTMIKDLDNITIIHDQYHSVYQKRVRVEFKKEVISSIPNLDGISDIFEKTRNNIMERKEQTIAYKLYVSGDVKHARQSLFNARYKSKELKREIASLLTDEYIVSAGGDIAWVIVQKYDVLLNLASNVFEEFLHAEYEYKLYNSKKGIVWEKNG